MVWGVCRRVLGHDHDADDAFQATFLVLIRKAAVILPRELVAAWLYGVAQQTARKARQTVAKRRQRERPEPPEVAEPAPRPVPDWQPLLDQEVSRLAEKYRLPLILCDLEGRTRKEAAQQLGWPEGTVAGRLARARALLARRLARHGVALPAAGLTAVLAPAAVMSATVKAASLVSTGQAAGVSANVFALTEGVLSAMMLTKIKTAGVLLTVLGLAAFTCAVLVAGQAGEPVQGPEKTAAPASKPQGNAPADPGPGPGKVQPKQSNTVYGLSAKIVVKSKLPLETDELQAELVLANESEKPLRLGMLYNHSGTYKFGHAIITFRPDDKQTAEQIAKHVITLKPGASVALPIKLSKLSSPNGKVRVSAAYQVSEAFGKEHKTWAGFVRAVVDVQQAKGVPDKGGDKGKDKGNAPKQVKLSLATEVEQRDGRPFVKVYLVNPSNIALEVVDWNEPALTVEKLCTVKVDGQSAELLGRGAFLMPGRKASKRTLPAESKTLLGVVAFDPKTAAQFTGYTPVVRRLVATGPNTYTLLPLTPAKHSVEIQVNRSLMTQFPAEVSPATVEVDLRDKPVKVEAEPKPEQDDKSKKLSLAAEVGAWKGKPYIKVYLVNPSNITLQLAGRNRLPALNVACAVKLDGAEAGIYSPEVVVLRPGLVKQALPAESKTLLGTFVFSPLSDQQFAGAMELRVRVPAPGPPGSYALLRLAPGKHTVEIRPSSNPTVQFPAEVRPVTVQVDLPK